jgi:hypothetical protein
MRVSLDIDSSDETDLGRKRLAAQLRALMLGAIDAARVDLAQHKLRPLLWYAERGLMRYGEALERDCELFKLPSQTLADGFGDCDRLVVWRCAELLNAGTKAAPLVYFRPGSHELHTQVRMLQTGAVEDTSRLMGM